MNKVFDLENLFEIYVAEIFIYEKNSDPALNSLSPIIAAPSALIPLKIPL